MEPEVDAESVEVTTLTKDEHGPEMSDHGPENANLDQHVLRVVSQNDLAPVGHQQTRQEGRDVA